MTPLVDVDTSLKQQLIALSTSAHCLFVRFRKHGIKACPSQLYHDVQALVQPLFLNTAKMQIWYPQQPFYLFQSGTDRAERSFGNARTLNHNRGFTALQLVRSLSISRRICITLNRHPEWDRGSKRLNTIVDHVNAKSWRGCVMVRMEFYCTCSCLRLKKSYASLLFVSDYLMIACSLSKVDPDLELGKLWQQGANHAVQALLNAGLC